MLFLNVANGKEDSCKLYKVKKQVVQCYVESAVLRAMVNIKMDVTCIESISQ